MTPRTKIISLVAVLVIAVVVLASQFIAVPERAIAVSRYTANTGELTAGGLVGQTFVALGNNLSAVAVQFATYSNRNNHQPIIFHLRQWQQDRDVRTVTVNAGDLNDNQLYRFSFTPLVDSQGKTFFFFITSPGSKSGDAITVDINSDDPYPQGSAYIVHAIPGAETQPDVLNRSGKPTVDVTFESYHQVPLRLAVIHQIQRTVTDFKTSWSQRRADYAQWAYLAIPALVIVILLLLPSSILENHAVLFALIIGAVAWRLVYATHMPATSDEGNYLYDAAALNRGVLAGGDGYVKAPLVVLWISLWQWLLGHTVLAGRLSSLIAGALTAWPLYSLGRELHSRRAGILAAAIWALAGAPAVATIYVHTQPLALFFGIAGLALLVRSLHHSVPLNRYLLLAGALLGLGVISRKSILALGLVPLALVIVERTAWPAKLKHLVMIGLGFGIVVGLFLGWAGAQYGSEGVQEAIGINSVEDGISANEPSQLEQVRAYSLRGMTPLFRESLPLIFLATTGWGLLLERAWRRKVVWILPLVVFWWAWSFFTNYEGSSVMVFGMRWIWYAMAALILVAVITKRAAEPEEDIRWRSLTALVAPLWLGGLIFFYMNWIKFHANYLVEFLPPLALLAGIGAASWARLFVASTTPAPAGPWLKRGAVALFVTILFWALFLSNYVTYTIPHTGQFELSAIQEAAAWARANIPLDQPIFTGAAIIPYVSGHRIALDIAHPRWYAYSFTRENSTRLTTFLPSVDAMRQAFRTTRWFLRDQQTGFSFIMEYSDIEKALTTDFITVKGIGNGSNTLTFYQRVK